jgi:SWI/SNF-related matrix-associated actin-dependent regulator of chromatin subfamily A3
MGLGKTITTLALIASDKNPNSPPVGPTLIVAPLSVLQNWEDQIVDHVAEPGLSLLVYHGSDRNPADLKKWVLVTPWQIVRDLYCLDSS